MESPSGRSFIFDLQEVLPTDADKDASRCNWIDILPVRAMKHVTSVELGLSVILWMLLSV